MGMAFNLYLCNKNQFEEIKLKTLNNETIEIIEYSIKSYNCEKLYIGLEYLFSKIFPENIVKIIFNGSDIISRIDFKSDNFKKLLKEEQINLYINTIQTAFIDHNYIYEINDIFIGENGDKIFDSFNENELNSKKIYPENWKKNYTLWNNINNQEEYSYKEYFKNEYLKIKSLFYEAVKNNNLIITEIK